MTPIEALNQLYQAARLAPLNAQTHEQIREWATIVQTALTPKDEKKNGTGEQK